MVLTRRDLGSVALAAAGLLAAPHAHGSDVPDPAPSSEPVRIAMLLYPGMTALDVVGPQALLAGLAPGSLHLVARRAGPVTSDTGVSLVATTDFAGCPADIDVLFVPGGDGTPAQMRDAATLAFLRPISVGDEVSCYCTLQEAGESSLAVKIETWVRDRTGGEPEKVTEGVFTYVALDDDGKPRAMKGGQGD